MNLKIKNFLLLSAFVVMAQSCNPLGGEGAKVDFTNPSVFKNLSTNISSVSVVNNQLVIDGTKLSSIQNVTLTNGTQTENLSVESASDAQIIANGVQAITIAAGSVFDLILSSALASATYQVTFGLANNVVTTAKIADGAVTGAKIGVTANPGDYLKYNGTTWVAAGMYDGQTYQGAWDASTNVFPSLGSPGDYYIVSVAGSFGTPLISYSPGDWIISDGYAWQKVGNSKAVSSFQGRRGVVALQPSDYVTLIDTTTNKLTGSKISDIADVDLSTPPTVGQVLKWNNTTSKWVPGDDTAGASGITLSSLSATSPLSYNSTSGVFSATAVDITALPLTNLASATGAVTATDTILGAFGKLMSIPTDYVSKSANTTMSTGTLALSGTAMITVPTATGTTLTEVANVTYVNNAIAANGQWDKGASNSINYSAGNVGIGTTSPTHALTFPTSSTGLALYNTSDQTTNYERVRSYWSGGIFYTSMERAGTGGARGMGFNGSIGQALTLESGASSGAVSVNATSATANSKSFRVGGTLSNTSTIQMGVDISNTISQSGTAGYTALSINPTETSLGSGVNRLISAQVGGSDKFYVDNTGNGYFLGNVGIGMTASTAALEVLGSMRSKNANGSLLFSSGTYPYLQGQNSSGIGTVQWITDPTVGSNLMDYSGTPSGMTGSFSVRNSMNGPGVVFKIDKDGNTGIGTSTPTGSLDARGRTKLTAAISIGATSFTVTDAAGFPPSGFVIIDGEIVNYSAIVANVFTCTATTMAHAINAPVYNNVGLILTNSGNVGVGTRTPSTKLFVNGSAMVGAPPASLTITTGSHAAGATTINVGSTAGYASSGVLFITDYATINEAVSYTGITANSFTGVVRGLYGVAASTIPAGSTVDVMTFGVAKDSTSEISHFITSKSGSGIGAIPKYWTANNGIYSTGNYFTSGIFTVASSLAFGTSSVIMNGVAASTSADFWRLTTNNDERFRADGSGNFGFNNHSPRGVIDVNTVSATRIISTINSSITTITVAANSFPASGTLIIDSEQMTYTGGGTTTFTVARAANSTTAASHNGSSTVSYMGPSAFILTSAGNIGIGTSAPTHSLTLPSTSTGFAAYNTADQTTNYERLVGKWSGNTYLFGTEFGGTGSGRMLQIGASATAGFSINRTLNISGATPFFSYTWSNTTLAGYGVDIGGGNGLAGTMTAQGALSITPTINQSGTATYKALYISPYEQAVVGTSNYLLDVGTNTAANNAGTHSAKFVVRSGGNVGIGVALPTSPLHVSTVNVTGNIANFVSTGASGAGCSIAWNGTSCSSDIRLKENIEPLDSLRELTKLIKLNPVHFTWKKDELHRRQTGFIAQDLEKLFPEFVKTESNGYKQVNYASFVSVLTSAVQELYKKWVMNEKSDLMKDAMIDRLKDELDMVKKENNAIKMYLCKKDPSAAFCH